MTDRLRIAHLRIAPQDCPGLPTSGLPPSDIHRHQDKLGLAIIVVEGNGEQNVDQHSKKDNDRQAASL